jgi:FtsP/CotA-like multicopper oxidase with cupredoxin domain
MITVKKALTILLVVLALYAVVYAITHQYLITHIGTIQTIGLQVYAEDAQTVLTQLDWGDLFRGNTYYRYAFLKSTSTVNSTIQYAVDNLPTYLTFTLYYQTGYWNNSIWQPTSDWINMQTSPYQIQPNEWLRLRFGLTVAEDATLGAFSFTIIISATA